jgi:hypothetical protein
MATEKAKRVAACSAALYMRGRAPVLASKTSSWIFLLVVGVLTLGSLVACSTPRT